MSEEKNSQQQAPVSDDAANNNDYYEAMKRIEEEKEEKKKQKKKKKRKGCLLVFVVVIGLWVLLSSLSGMLDQKAYRDSVTEALEEKTYTAEVLNEYIAKTKDSDSKKAKNYFKWSKLALENEYVETSVKLVKLSVAQDEGYKEKATDYYSEYLEDNKDNTAVCQNLMKQLNVANIVIDDEIKDLFKYQSIRAVFVSDNSTPGSSVSSGDFEVYGLYKNGTEVKLNDDEFEIVGAEEYGINTTQTIKIKDTANGCETSVNVRCPGEKFFDKYSRQAFANEFYKRMKAKGVTGYGMEIDKNEKDIITQVSFYRVIGGYKAYCYFLKFYSTSTQGYKDIYVETNGTKYRYNEMQILKEILIGMTFGSEDSGRVINDLLGTDGSRTEAGVRYSASKEDFSGTIQYTLSATIVPDYITAVK